MYPINNISIGVYESENSVPAISSISWLPKNMYERPIAAEEGIKILNVKSLKLKLFFLSILFNIHGEKATINELTGSTSFLAIL